MNYPVTLHSGEVIDAWWFVHLLEKKARELNSAPRGGDRLMKCQRCGIYCPTECHHVVPIRIMVYWHIALEAPRCFTFKQLYDVAHDIYENREHSLFAAVNKESNKINVCFLCHRALDVEARRNFKTSPLSYNEESQAYEYRAFKAISKTI